MITSLVVLPLLISLCLGVTTVVSTAEGQVPTYHSRFYEIPILRKKTEGHSKLQRRGTITGESGLGNKADTLYSVPIQVGNLVVAVNLDTGSSDLWIVSDACTTHSCAGAQVKRYLSSAANSTGVGVTFNYGDSSSGTYAVGTISLETAVIAGIVMREQPFAFVNDTTNIVVEFGIAGLFGLGFPSGSKIHEAIVNAHDGFTIGTDEFITSINTWGPLLSRLTMTNALEAPIFSVMLQRDTIDISGNGILTIGKLPEGIDNSSLTWVPVRLYQPEEGGLNPPNFALNEVYPLRWEVEIDGVFFDGEQLPDTVIPTSDGVNSMKTSALIDTGNSFLRGPEDVVNKIFRTVSPSYNPADQNSKPRFPCSTPHHLSFRIGGQMFPIDPRDFIGQSERNNVTTCIADNLISTDPPHFGALFRWSLGDPFFKSNLVVFYYGNLTHPSLDPPRIGFLSLVPGNADELLAQAVSDAQSHGGNFEETLMDAPTASAAAAFQVTISFGSPSTNLATGTTLLTSPTSITNDTSQTIPQDRKSSSVLRCALGGNIWVVMITIFLVPIFF